MTSSSNNEENADDDDGDSEDSSSAMQKKSTQTKQRKKKRRFSSSFEGAGDAADENFNANEINNSLEPSNNSNSNSLNELSDQLQTRRVSSRGRPLKAVVKTNSVHF